MKKRVLLLAFAGLFVNSTYSSVTKPNIVVVLIDDMGWKDVGYMGSKYYETPNIDMLANAGMKFTNAYANAANCAPTRACLLSGQYTPRHGVYNVGEGERGKGSTRRLQSVENSMELPLEKITIAEALKPAGYVSAAIGKWHVENTPKEQGFDFSVDRDELGFKGHLNAQTGEYLTDRLTEEAVGFIKQNRDKPFFLYLAHHAVHTPIQAKEVYSEYFKGKETDGCQNNAKFAAMIKSVDESVGKVCETLKQLRIDKNTIVIFTSDNGGFGPVTCMDPLRGGKGMYYEGGIREPMFVYWPGKVKAGTVCDVPVISCDIYPTALEIAGLNKPDSYQLDGTSILKIVTGKSSKLERTSLFWHFPMYLESYGAMNDESRDPLYRTRPVSVIRKGDWKLLMFHEEWVLDGGIDKAFTNNSIELYNLKNDIGETKNLVGENKDKATELLNDLLNWQKQVQAPLANKPNPDYRSE